MKVLTFNSEAGVGIVGEGQKRVNLTLKPDITVLFDSIHYEPDVALKFKVLNGVEEVLTPEEETQCELFIASYVFPPAMVLGVDQLGNYLGHVEETDLRLFKIIKFGTPNEDFWRYDFNLNEFVYIEAVNSDGKYIGNVSLHDPMFYKDVQSQPNNFYDIWDFNTSEWIDGRDLTAYKYDVLSSIDAKCGQVRLKYITDVPGQAEPILIKASQAREFLSSPGQDYTQFKMVESEYLALLSVDGTVTPEFAAQSIVDMEDFWINLAALIEKTRRMTKEKIAIAASKESVDLLMIEFYENVNVL